MMKSETIGALAAAHAKAQGQMRHAVKDSINPHFKNRYADLASVLDAVRGPLADHGLAVVQTVETGEGGPHVTTTLLHSSGEWISSGYTMPSVKADPQGWGSAITYARRYALAAICGIGQDDDDAQSAGQRDGVTDATRRAVQAELARLGIETDRAGYLRPLNGGGDIETEKEARAVLAKLRTMKGAGA